MRGFVFSVLVLALVPAWLWACGPSPKPGDEGLRQREGASEPLVTQEPQEAQDGGLEPSPDGPPQEAKPEVPAKPVVHATQPCAVAGVQKLELPYYYDVKGSPRFVYNIRKDWTKNPDATVLIALPGGPGQVNITAQRGNFPLGGIPSGVFNVVQTDLRGAGCNRKLEGEFPVDFHTTTNAARDIIELVRALEKEAKKPLNYIVFGGSYGTIHATVFANLAKKAGITLPRALVLEGTLGKPPLFDQHIENYRKQWKKLKGLLTPEWQKRFDTNQLPHADARAWGGLVHQALMQGPIPNQGYQLVSWLSPFGSAATLKKVLESHVQANRALSAPDARFSRGFLVIACRELWGAYHGMREMKDGQLHKAGRDFCAAEKLKLAHPYDPKEWPVSVPIVYFQGPNDPATTYEGARYHLSAQSQTLRYFVEVAGAAHPVLTLSLRLKSCSTPIWKAIDTLDKAPEKLKEALSTCQHEKDSKVRMELHRASSP